MQGYNETLIPILNVHKITYVDEEIRITKIHLKIHQTFDD